MITIDQLLESVDLDFEPRFATKDNEGDITIWAKRPTLTEGEYSDYWTACGECVTLEKLKLADFENKDWQDCIYEVPRKTTGKIELLKETTERVMLWKINELVNYVNALIESNNIHEKQIDELQMKLEPEKCAVNELKGAKNE